MLNFMFSPSLLFFQMNMKAIHCSLMAALALKLAGLCYSCKISEYPCKGGAFCVPLDKFCDGKDDCGDGSDEPKLCTGKIQQYLPGFLRFSHYSRFHDNTISIRQL